MGCNPKATWRDDGLVNIAETFASIQGEGRDSGAHALFIRLSGCNLRCPWCDSQRTWNSHIVAPQHELLDTMKEYRRHYGNNYVVWTGGEPLLQEKKIYNMIEQTRDWYHMVETNGTIIPEKPHLFNAIAVSPKHARNIEDGWNFDGNRWLTIRNAYVKLVVEDIKEAIDFQERYNFPSQWFFVMTRTDQPYNAVKFRNKERKIFDDCIEHGFNYSPRLQLYFGAR